jgi:hypothetical protein
MIINPYRFSAAGGGYLLDDYTGAAGAWSLRALSSAYASANVVEVQRSSDSATLGCTEAEITDGTLETFITGTNGTVRTLYDQTGGGANLIQASAVKQPKIWDASTGLVTLGGKPAMDTTGTTDQYLATSATNAWLAGSDFSVFTVSLHDSSTYLGALWSNDGVVASTGESRTIFNLSTNQVLMAFGGSNTANSGTGSLSTWTNGVQTSLSVVATGMLTGESHTIDSWVDGAGNSQWTGTGKLTPPSSKFIFGSTADSTSGNEWDGRIQECIVFASDKSADRTGIDGNITTHYGI